MKPPIYFFHLKPLKIICSFLFILIFTAFSTAVFDQTAQNKASQLIARSPFTAGTITVYQHKNYGGKYKVFSPGSWNKNSLSPVGNDEISSIKIPAGMEVTLFEHDTYKGKKITLTKSYADLHGLGFGDEVSSLIVKTVSTSPQHPTSGMKLPNNFVGAETLKVETGPLKKTVKSASLPCDCHIQGIGWSPESNQTILTCQDKCSTDRGGYLMLYNGNNPAAVHSVKSRAAARYNHPSAIQVFNKAFPVAMADGKTDNSYIEFYKISGSQLSYQVGKDITVTNRHIGALAYATIGNNTYMIGAGWDAANLTIWKAPTKNAISGFSQTAYLSNASSGVINGIDNNWSAYNSLWLGQLANGKIVLVATHGGGSRSWLDIWEVQNMDTSTPKFKKIAKKWMAKPGFAKNYFFEGTTIKMTGPSLSDLRVLACPHDYGTSGCPTGTRCTTGVYDIRAY